MPQSGSIQIAPCIASAMQGAILSQHAQHSKGEQGEPRSGSACNKPQLGSEATCWGVQAPTPTTEPRSGSAITSAINLHGLQTHFVAHSFSRPVHPQHATAWLTWGLLHAKPRRGFTFTILHPHIGRATEWLRM